MSQKSSYERASGVERILCVVAIIFCASFLVRVISADGEVGLLFYVMPLAIAGFALGRLMGWLPGGVARGGAGPGGG